MEERDTMAMGAGSRAAVDQLEARGLERGEGGVDVGNAIRDVVETRSAPGDEAADRRVRTERLEELQPAVSGPDETELDTLALDPLAAGTPGARGGFEGWEGVIERMHGDSDVVEGQAPQWIVRTDL